MDKTVTLTVYELIPIILVSFSIGFAVNYMIEAISKDIKDKQYPLTRYFGLLLLKILVVIVIIFLLSYVHDIIKAFAKSM